jgi:hypothetical protein
MKILFLAAALLAEFAYSQPSNVYICESPYAKRYHLKANCHGLSHCTHKVIKVTLEEAKKRGKTLCGYEK